jgi:hypothetical protein
MLFKVYDTSNKFTQYVSLCVDVKTLSNNSNDLHTMICKTNIPNFDKVQSCYYNYYNALMSPINIHCSIDGRTHFFIKEVLSDKRLKEIKDSSFSYASAIASPSSVKYVSDGYTANYYYTTATTTTATTTVTYPGSLYNNINYTISIV